MKKFGLLVSLLCLVSCSNGGEVTPTPVEPTPVEPTPTIQTVMDKYKVKTETSVLPDWCYKNGFLSYSSSLSDYRTQVKDGVLTYDNERETSGEGVNSSGSYWQASTWGSAYTFCGELTTLTKNNGIYTYENPTRKLVVNTNTSELQMTCDADLDYKIRFPETGKYDNTHGTWSHFLIEQSFPKELWTYAKDLKDNDKDIYVSMDVTLDEVTYKGEGTPIGTDVAQLLFYTQLRNDVKEGQSYEEYGSSSSRIWFGVPIFDTRYQYITQSAAPDVLSDGSLGHLIYSMDNRSYMGRTQPTVGTTYHIDVPLLEEIQNAFIYGVQKEYLPNMKWENLYIAYMNFGWEIKGNFKCSSTIKNLDIYVK